MSADRPHRRLPPGSAAALSLPAPLYRRPSLAAPVHVAAWTGEPPRARQVPWADHRHDDIRPDEFRWLADRQNPAARAYLEAENAYTEAAMQHTERLQERLFHELAGRIEETDESVPEPL